MGGKTCLLPLLGGELISIGLSRDFQFLLLLSAPLGLVALVHGVILKHDLFSKLKVPLDLNLRFNDKRIFGENKTLRGLVVHLVFGILGTWAMGYIQPLFPKTFEIISIAQEWPFLGLSIGVGMTLGELPNSFIKRQLGIGPGSRPGGPLGICFLILDQIDMVLGIWALLFAFFDLPLRLLVISIPIALVFHPTITFLGHRLGMRQTPF